MSSFHERLTRLLGSSTWREPMGSVGTKQSQMTDANHVAAALGMAREGQGDIGPDIAVCLYLRSDYKRAGIVRTLAEAIKGQRHRAVRENHAHLRTVCDQAFGLVVWGVPGRMPEGMKPLHWSVLYPVACSILSNEAEEAVNRAARIERGAAA
jgi:hypothetical protein